MPIITGKPISTTPGESIARVEIFTDASASQDDWRIVYHWETGPYDSAGNLIGPTQFGTRRVEVRFGDIKNDPDVITAMGIIKKKGYAYRDQQIADQVTVKPPIS